MFTRLSTPPDTFTADLWDDLVARPIEVGIWMAGLNRENGTTARPLEEKALNGFLGTAARKFENLPLIAAICRAGRKRAPVFLPPPDEPALFADCRATLRAMGPKVQSLELNAYKLLLVEMAEAIADSSPGQTISGVQKLGINRLIEAIAAGNLVEKWRIHDETMPQDRSDVAKRPIRTTI